MAERPPKLNCLGRLTNVQTKFAFVEAQSQTVFCPLAAGIPQEENVPDMRRKYQVGDSVSITAVLQVPKNGVYYVARKMRHARAPGVLDSNGDLLASGDPSTSAVNCTCYVGLCLPDHVIADSTEFGNIFVHRSSFGIFEKEYSTLVTGDKLNVNIRAQVPKNGVQWVALAVKEVTKALHSSNSIFSGSGTVVGVEPMTAYVFSVAYGQIFCPIINWQGGDRGTSASGLDEILGMGERIAFEAVHRDGLYRAIRWSFLNNLKKTSGTKVDSYCQTVPSLQDCVIRYLMPHLMTMKDTVPLVQMFIDSEEIDSD